MSGQPALAEADLHALVDGCLERERRADVLRRLAASPIDRARVDTWHDQNELIRSAFAEIEHEALPAVLDLAPLLRPAGAVHLVSKSGRSRFVASVAIALLIAGGVTGLWIATPASDGLVSDTSSRGATAGSLAIRSMQALAGDLDAMEARHVAGLPVGPIPDLSGAGFALNRVESDVAVPASLVMHYQNAEADRVVISISRSVSHTSTPPEKVGQAYAWRRADKTYAMAGTIQSDRLLVLAKSLHESVAKD